MYVGTAATNVIITLFATGHAWFKFSAEIANYFQLFALLVAGTRVTHCIFRLLRRHTAVKTNIKIAVLTRTFHAGVELIIAKKAHAASSNIKR